MAFNFIANTAAILAIGSNAIEAGELGTRRASKSADTAVAVNPEDERYKSIVGKKICGRTR